MRRLLAALSTACLLVSLGGCDKSYRERVDFTLKRMQYLQRLDQFLQTYAGESFQQLGIYLRPPKPLTPATQTGLRLDPDQFDLIATFLDVSGTPAKGADPQQAAQVLRLHVLARAKQAKAQPAKGEEVTIPFERGEFQETVFFVLADNFGGFDPADGPTLIKSDRKGPNEFRRIDFEAANGDSVHVYFYKMDDYEIALIWDIPKPLERTAPASTGRDLTLESLSVGQRAVMAFQGIDPEEGVIDATVQGDAPGQVVAF